MRLPACVASTLAILGVLLRAGLFLHDYTSGKSMLPDSSGYERPALSFLQSGKLIESEDVQDFFSMLYGVAPSHQARPMFLRTPGYPLFISSIYRLGADRRAMVLIQIALSGLVVWLTYVLGRTLFSQWVGVLAAACIAIDPASVWSAQLVLPETLFTLLLIALVLGGIRLIGRPSLSAAVWLSLLLALAILCKPVAYYLPPLIAGLLVWARVPKRLLLAAALPVVLLVGAWQFRNLRVLGTTAVSGAQSTDLFLWRAAGIVARQHGTELEPAQRTLIRTIPDPAKLSPAELDRRFFAAGIAMVRAHPFLYFCDTVKGLVVILVSPGARSLPAFFDLPVVLFVGSYVLFLAAIYAGILLHAAAKRGRALAPAPLLAGIVALYVIALHAGADSSCRYRVPAMPFLAVFGASGLVCALQFATGKTPRGTP